MALDKDQLVKVYINRLVRSLVPSEFGEEFTQSISSNLINDLTNGGETSYDTSQLLYKVKTHFISNGDHNSWIKFHNVLDQLAKLKSNDNIVSYLVFLLVLSDNRDVIADAKASPLTSLSPQLHTLIADAKASPLTSLSPQLHTSLPTRLSTASPKLFRDESRDHLSRDHLSRDSLRDSQFPRDEHLSVRDAHFPRDEYLARDERLARDNHLSRDSPQPFANSLQHFRDSPHLTRDSPLPFKDPLLTRDSPRLRQSPFNRQSFISRQSSVSSRISKSPRIYDELQSRSPIYNELQFDTSKPLAALIGPYYQDPEPMILTYLSYSLLGLDSKILQFDDAKNQLILPQGLNQSYVQLLSAVCECGLLYRYLIKANKQEMNSPIKLAYMTIQEKQLQIYENFINQLFNKTNQPASLIAIYHAITPWIYNLRILYHLTQNLQQNGDEFLSQVYELTKFGDLNIKSLSENIFKYIGQPYYEIIEHWMIRGDLIDESNEYFIKFNPTTNFNDVFQYLPEKIPKFIPQSIGKKLFHIGKILIFLNKCCKQLQWLNDYADKYTRVIYQMNQGLQSMTINEISRVVNMQYQQLLDYLTEIIYGKPNELFIHLTNFKRFYFMENNDFIENLIVKGQDIFQEASTNISSNQLSTLLTEAIATTSVKNNPYNNRLDARVLDLLHGALGWDVFTIEYRIDDLPVHYLFQSQMNQYLKMFNFLWRLRQLQFLLNENFLLGNDLRKVDMHGIFRLYRKSNGHTPRSEKVQWIVKSFNTVGMIRFKFINYLNVIINYLSFDVIETNFQTKIVEKIFKSVDKKSDLININPEFINKINQQEQVPVNSHEMNDLTIDEIIDIHTIYLNSISKNKLLNEESHGKVSGLTFIEQLHSLLELIFDFIKSSEHFYGVLINYVLISNIDNEDTTMDDEIVAGEQSIQESVRKIYHEIYRNYKVQLDTFIKDLRNDIDLREMSKLF